MARRKSDKGGPFERHVCGLLSRWWTAGVRDDVFWRTPNSGGRATVRRSKGKASRNQEGDVCALDTGGEPLVRCFHLELKRGYSGEDVQKLLDGKRDGTRRPGVLAGWVMKAVEQARAHGARHWAVIWRRDGKDAVITLPLAAWAEAGSGEPDVLLFRVVSGCGTMSCVMLRLDDFLANVTPERVKELGAPDAE